MFVGNVGQDTQSTSRHDFRPPGTPAGVSQQPAIPANVSPNRKWIVGATVGAGVAALAILGVVLATWHSASSPSPAALVAAPAAPVAAPPEAHSSETTGTFLPLADVVSMVSGDFQDQIGHAPERVSIALAI